MPNFRVEPYPEPTFPPDTLGGLCETCGNPIPAGLAGTLTHPTCDPEFTPLAAALARTLRKRTNPTRK